MTPLGREIAETIAAEGPMRLDRYMALCLGHPVHGYYATRDPFGARGDFVTAPEISQMFGELIGLWCAEVWRMMGSPARIKLVELGPGRGTLMADMLRAGRAAPGFCDAAEVVLVETSSVLREIQARTLLAFGDRVSWADTVEDALSPQTNSRHPGHSEAKSRDLGEDEALFCTSPRWGEVARRSRAGEGALRSESPAPPHPALRADLSPPRRGGEPPHPDDDSGSSADAAVRDDGLVPAIVVANEFFDALPIRQFVRTGLGWRERVIGLDPGGAFAFGRSADAPQDIRLPDAPVGAAREVCPHALDIAAAIADHVATHGGAMLAIDYGYLSGHGDTLQAMRAHGFADPLATPGEADVTAHVDFAALGEAALRAGASVMAPLMQRDLLERLGIGARAEALSRGTPDQREAIAAAVERLTNPSPAGMGALFKALAFGDPALGPLPGFAPAPPITLKRQGSPS